jgi:hypothetical protein
MTDIPINPVTRRVQFTGNTGTGPFAFTFNIFVSSDIAVYKNSTLLTLTTDYTVTIAGDGTGSVTLTGSGSGTPVILADVLTIVGARDLSRTTDFVTAGDLRAVALNEQLDSTVIMAQQLDEKSDRALKFDQFDVYGDATLPVKASRLGTVLGFNATTGNPEAGPTIADVSTLAAITADIATLADIQDGTVATDAITNVNTIRANVTTVAGISGNVTTVAGNTSNINAVVANATNINTVAGIDSNVTTVAGISANVTAVAGNATNINTVAADGTDIGIVSTNIANVNTVAGDITNVNTNATNIASINTNAANIIDIQNAEENAASALSSKNAAATSETNASTSASTATTQAGISTTKAGEAATSASNASTSASTATTQAGISTTKAGEAAASETAAAGSASTATTQAGIATTKAGESAASASASATSASASEAAKDAALAALDSFDDRYLGAKASDPTLDNDGNALVAGALYYNTTDNVMKVYTGSAWVAAYASLSGALLVANNLSDLASNSSARTNLGLATVAATGAYADVTGTPAAALPLAGGTLTGMLGIGATSPSWNLEVNGRALIADTTARLPFSVSRAGGGAVTNGATIVSGAVAYFNGNSAASDALRIGSMDNGTGAYYIDVSNYNATAAYDLVLQPYLGNVGIGTTAPTHKLTVGGYSNVDAANKLAIGDNAGYQALIYMESANETLTIENTSDYAGRATIFKDNGTERMRINSSGNVGIGTSSPSQKLDVNGSVNIPNDYSYGFGGAGSNTYISGNNASNILRFNTNGSERMRIFENGNVGIGTTDSRGKLQIGSGVGGGYVPSGHELVFGANNSDITFLSANNEVSVDGTIGAWNTDYNFQNSKIVFNKPGWNIGELQFFTNAGSGITERMRIDVTGNVLVGTTSADPNGIGSSGRVVINTKNGGQAALTCYNVGTTAVNIISLENGNGQVGRIQINGTATSYLTSSDYRLKEDWQLISGASDRVLALKPVNFAWKVDGSRVDGFLAHEVAEVVPEAIAGTKDAMRDQEYEVTAAIEATYDEDGNELTAAVEAVMGTRSVPDYQGIDQSKLVPLLTAALQEALTEISALKARVTSLEG